MERGYSRGWATCRWNWRNQVMSKHRGPILCEAKMGKGWAMGMYPTPCRLHRYRSWGRRPFHPGIPRVAEANLSVSLGKGLI